MSRLTPAPAPQPSVASLTRSLSRVIGQLLKDVLRLGAALALLYVLAVCLGVFR